MKKLLVTLLALLLALGGVAAMATEEYAEPILFRGLEWGTSLEALLEMGVMGNQSPDVSTIDAHEMKWFLHRQSDYRDHSEHKMYSRVMKHLDVGGKDNVSYAYFVCVPGEDGMVNNNDQGTLLLVGGEYQLKNYSDALFEEFTQKLTTLYGDVDNIARMEVQYDGEKVEVYSLEWYGADGTCVALNNFEGKEIRIAYASGNYDELLDSATIDNLNGL